MTLDLKALALSCGILWGGAILGVGLIATAVQGYGAGFLSMVASVYPWFAGDGSIADSLLGGAMGFVDGAVCGVLLGGLYNLFRRR